MSMSSGTMLSGDASSVTPSIVVCTRFPVKTSLTTLKESALSSIKLSKFKPNSFLIAPATALFKPMPNALDMAVNKLEL